MDKAFHAAALKFVQRDPFEGKVVMAEHAHDPRPYIFRLFLGHGIGVGTELQVNPPNIVRLTVQQRRTPGMKRRIEPEPALAGEIRGHLDVRNQELIFEHLAGEIRAYHLPQ